MKQFPPNPKESPDVTFIVGPSGEITKGIFFKKFADVDLSRCVFVGLPILEPTWKLSTITFDCLHLQGGFFRRNHKARIAILAPDFFKIKKTWGVHLANQYRAQCKGHPRCIEINAQLIKPAVISVFNPPAKFKFGVHYYARSPVSVSTGHWNPSMITPPSRIILDFDHSKAPDTRYVIWPREEEADEGSTSVQEGRAADTETGV